MDRGPAVSSRVWAQVGCSLRSVWWVGAFGNGQAETEDAHASCRADHGDGREVRVRCCLLWLSQLSVGMKTMMYTLPL